jgi:3-deoxy-D-manno-octulosonic-acid transferase
MRNLSHDTEEMREKQLINQVKSGAEIAQIIQRYYDDPRELVRQSIHAYEYLKSNQGVLKNTWNQIPKFSSQ